MISFNRLLAPLLGKTPDEAAVTAAIPQATTCLDALEQLKGNDRFMVGRDISIADLMLAPQLATFLSTPEGQHLLSGRALADWLAMMNERPSMQATTRERLLARESSGRVMPAQIRDSTSAGARPSRAGSRGCRWRGALGHWVRTRSAGQPRSGWPNAIQCNNGGGDSMSEKPAYNYDIYIGAPVGKVWKGIVDGEMTKHYVYGTRLESKLKKGAPVACVGDGGFKVVDGEILEIEPDKRRQVMSWNAHWDDSVARDRPSRITYELSAAGPSTTKLHVIHDNFDGPSATYKASVEGWPLMMSSLKSLLETGKPLATK